MTDTIAGVPSIVMGIFAYTIIVLPQGHFSAWSGAVVLAFIMLPIVIRSTEEMLKLVPGSLREGSLALGRAGVADVRSGAVAGGIERDRDWVDAGDRPCRRRGGSDALHCVRESVHEHVS